MQLLQPHFLLGRAGERAEPWRVLGGSGTSTSRARGIPSPALLHAGGRKSLRSPGSSTAWTLPQHGTGQRSGPGRETPAAHAEQRPWAPRGRAGVSSARDKG